MVEIVEDHIPVTAGVSAALTAVASSDTATVARELSEDGSPCICTIVFLENDVADRVEMLQYVTRLLAQVKELEAARKQDAITLELQAKDLQFVKDLLEHVKV